MFNKLKQLSNLKQMRDQAKRLQRELAQEKVEIKESDIRVVVRGDQRIELIEIDGEQNQSLVNLLNKALGSAQKKAARKMMGDMGSLKGLLG